MVQMTHARTFNPQTGEWGEISAKAYREKKEKYRALEDAGQLECHCPDPRCSGVRLSHHDGHMQMFYGDRGSYQLDIPSHFQRWPGTAAHHPDCEIVKQYGAYQGTMRDLGALSLGHGAFIVNLNFPTTHSEGPVRRPRNILGGEFRVATTRETKDSPPREKRVLSHGIKNLNAMAAMIEQAAYDNHFRRNILFRRGSEIFSLEQLYQETPLALFRRAQQVDNQNKAYARALTVFQPAAPREFWQIEKHGPGKIMGQPDVVKGRDGYNHHVAMALHVENRALYYDLKKMFREGFKSFLLYSDKIHIDRAEIRERNAMAGKGAGQRAFMVHVHVTRPEQIVPWTAPPAQKPFDFGDSMPGMLPASNAGMPGNGNGIAPRP